MKIKWGKSNLYKQFNKNSTLQASDGAVILFSLPLWQNLSLLPRANLSSFLDSCLGNLSSFSTSCLESISRFFNSCLAVSAENFLLCVPDNYILFLSIIACLIILPLFISGGFIIVSLSDNTMIPGKLLHEEVTDPGIMLDHINDLKIAVATSPSFTEKKGVEIIQKLIVQFIYNRSVTLVDRNQQKYIGWRDYPSDAPLPPIRVPGSVGWLPVLNHLEFPQAWKKSHINWEEAHEIARIWEKLPEGWYAHKYHYTLPEKFVLRSKENDQKSCADYHMIISLAIHIRTQGDWKGFQEGKYTDLKTLLR